MLTNLRSRVETWLAAKAIITGMDRLETQHLGTKLKQAMDDKFGDKRSPDVEARLVKYLQTVIKEIQAK